MEFLLFFAILFCVAAFFLGIRNNQVHQIRIAWIEKWHLATLKYINSCTQNDEKVDDKEYNRRLEILKDIRNITYSSMLYSLKPLNDELWLTEEQFNYINNIH